MMILRVAVRVQKLPGLRLELDPLDFRRIKSRARPTPDWSL